MWQIIISELIYNKSRLYLLIILPLFYSVAVLYNFSSPGYSADISKIVYPVGTGMFAIYIIFFSYIISIKEKRNIQLIVLPIKQNSILSGRLLFVIIQIASLVFITLFFANNVDPNWQPITNRVIYQYGTTFLLGSALNIVYELFAVFELKNDLQKIGTGVILIAIVISLLFIADMYLFPILDQTIIGLLYLLIGIIEFIFSLFLFTKRTTYLS